jgi:GNAT superfamily N-acetyltransferase
LTSRHDRSAFASGSAELDDWFQRRAGQDERRNVARVFVAVGDAGDVVGFYTLSSLSISIEELPSDIAKKLPRYAGMPAALIGRLARHERVRGKGVGGLLLADAVRRALDASRSVAIFAIVVDAKDDAAVEFYRGFGFTPFPQRRNRLFLLASVAAAALARTSDAR